MIRKMLNVCILSYFYPGAGFATDSSEATNQQPSLNTNPQIERYPGHVGELSVYSERAQIARVAHLLEILNSLGKGENEKAIKFLEDDLEFASNGFKAQKNSSNNVFEIMKQVADYNHRFKSQPASDSLSRPTQ